MKNSFIKSLALLLFSLCLFVSVGTLVSCKSANVLPTNQTNKIVTVEKKVIVHDTIVQTEKDSSYYRAYLQCVNGKVIFKSNTPIVSHKGKTINPPKVRLINNQLEVDCKVEAQKIFLKWKETYEKENRQETIRIPYSIEKPLTTWQKVQIWCGRLFLLLAFLVGLFSLFKFKKIV